MNKIRVEVDETQEGLHFLHGFRLTPVLNLLDFSCVGQHAGVGHDVPEVEDSSFEEVALPRFQFEASATDPAENLFEI